MHARIVGKADNCDSNWWQDDDLNWHEWVNDQAETARALVESKAEPLNSSSHRNEYASFMRRGMTKKFKSLHADLATRFNDRNQRGDLFRDWMQADGDWEKVTHTNCGMELCLDSQAHAICVDCGIVFQIGQTFP